MKKTFAIVLAISLLIIILSACTEREDKVISSIGEYKNHEYYSEGEFQDFTDYAKYYYDSADFTDNKYFSKIQQSDINALNEHLDDFESWISTYRENDITCEIVVHYDFDRCFIDYEDYLYIYSEQGDPWEDGNIVLYNYDIYFFDTQSNTLYYFHNNI